MNVSKNWSTYNVARDNFLQVHMIVSMPLAWIKLDSVYPIFGMEFRLSAFNQTAGAEYN